MEETSNEILSESLEQTDNLMENDVVDLANISEDETANPNSEQSESETKQSPASFLKPVKDLQLPHAKIKHIMKMDPDVQLVQKDAISLVGKAAELFIEFLTKESYKQLAGQKRRTVMKRDIDVTVENIPQLCFLDGALE
ncbi:unnamed protein product [Ceutorhynchus assimilis]|uniref:Transcription factor CBF/NF-Y/archaeal histone domain-containing protein n=1 Tax=Ceutorhynchus assimilis TaxID=467358 RepID=A0A9N9MT39_9CUCU|nr:unnamed protein product [Ceutorhynchus assimilis]